MRRLLFLLSLALLAECYAHAPAQAQVYGYPPGYYPPGYYRAGTYPPGPPPPPPIYRTRPAPYAGTPGNSPENCGTPDEPKPCPPMPRVPLPYFPPNR